MYTIELSEAIHELSQYILEICTKLFSVYKIVPLTLVIIFSIIDSTYSASFTVVRSKHRRNCEVRRGHVIKSDFLNEA